LQKRKTLSKRWLNIADRRRRDMQRPVIRIVEKAAHVIRAGVGLAPILLVVLVVFVLFGGFGHYYGHLDW
jgi:hypothetical protein